MKMVGDLDPREYFRWIGKSPFSTLTTYILYPLHVTFSSTTPNPPSNDTYPSVRFHVKTTGKDLPLLTQVSSGFKTTFPVSKNK